MEKNNKPTEPDEPPRAGSRPRQIWPAFVYHRRDRIRAEVERNRRGEYVVPTWVLALILVLFIGAWVLLVAVA